MNLILDFTRLCNSKCVTCSIWKTHNPVTLGPAPIEKLLSQIDRLDSIYVTGGEPYINPIILMIAELVKKYHPNCLWSGATNAIHPRTIEVIKQVRDIGLNVYVEVSLEGNREEHDLARGTKGNYDKSVKLMEDLTREGIPFSVNTISDAGAAEARRLGVPYGQNSPRFGKRYETEGKGEKRVIKDCPGAKSMIVCTPEGDIYPCEEYKPELLLGNIIEQDLKDMRFEEVIKYIGSGKCQPCGMSCWWH